MSGDATTGKQAPLSGALLAQLGDRITGHAGLALPAWALAARVRERMAALDVRSAAAYVDLVTSRGGAGELDVLLEAVRVGETRFFRHTAHVDALIHTVIPALRERGAGRPIRAWSAGCASGEEAYTLAMILVEMTPPAVPGVLATDLSARAIESARRGEYPDAALSHVPERWRDQAFESIGGRSRVRERIARCVRFEQHNLAHDAFPSGLDVIWCRNVLMYLTPDVRRRVVDRLVASLTGGGVLFVGYSESLRDVAALAPVRTHGTVIYRKTSSGRSSTTSPAGARAVHAGLPRAAASPGDGAPPARHAAPDGVTLALSGRYDDGARLSEELARVLSAHHRRIAISLDGAEFLGDQAAAVLRRAHRAARASGVELVLVAERPGTTRWVRRHGLAPGMLDPGHDREPRIGDPGDGPPEPGARS